MTTLKYIIGKRTKDKLLFLARRPHGDYGYHWTDEQEEAVNYSTKTIPLITGCSLVGAHWYTHGEHAEAGVVLNF